MLDPRDSAFCHAKCGIPNAISNACCKAWAALGSLSKMRLQIHQRGVQSQRVAELVKLLAKRFCERLESEHQRE